MIQCDACGATCLPDGQCTSCLERRVSALEECLDPHCAACAEEQRDVEELESIEREMTPLTDKLANWRPVIEAALALVEDMGVCHFCNLDRSHPRGSWQRQEDHHDDCPLRGVEL